jgi:hypothetical protein
MIECWTSSWASLKPKNAVKHLPEKFEKLYLYFVAPKKLYKQYLQTCN